MRRLKDILTKTDKNDGETSDRRSHDMNSMEFHHELESVEDELMDFIIQKKRDARKPNAN